MPPNRQLRKIARAEGIRNPADVYDETTSAAIAREIEQLRPNIRELLDEAKLTPELKKRLETIWEFCAELSDTFQEEFLRLLEEYRQKNKHLSEKITGYLLEKKFDFPQFTIAHGDEANNLLDNYKLREETGRDSLLLALQLPKPLAQFWWKGGYDPYRGNAGADLAGAAIEWGHFYRLLMHSVWGMQGYYENEKGLNFYRINGVGEHDPKQYYYVWEMADWRGQEEDTTYE